MNRKALPVLGWVCLALLIVLAAFGLGQLPFWFPSLRYGLDPDEYGDAFGFVNALISAAAFAAVAVALFMQNTSLRLQQQEIDETQRELRRAAEAQEKSGQLDFISTYVSAVATMVEHRRAAAAENESGAGSDPGSGASRATTYARKLDALINLLEPLVRENLPKGPAPSCLLYGMEEMSLFMTWLEKGTVESGTAKIIVEELDTYIAMLRWHPESRAMREAIKSAQHLRARLSELIRRNKAFDGPGKVDTTPFVEPLQRSYKEFVEAVTAMGHSPDVA